MCLEQKKLQEGQLGVSLVFSPHFDVICDLLLNKRRESWDLFISCKKESEMLLTDTSSMCLFSK